MDMIWNEGVESHKIESRRNPGEGRKIRPCGSNEVLGGTAGDKACSITPANQTLPVKITHSHSPIIRLCRYGINLDKIYQKGFVYLEREFLNHIFWLVKCCSLQTGGFHGIEMWRQWSPGASLYPSDCTTDMRKQLKCTFHYKRDEDVKQTLLWRERD